MQVCPKCGHGIFLPVDPFYRSMLSDGFFVRHTVGSTKLMCRHCDLCVTPSDLVDSHLFQVAQKDAVRRELVPV